MVQLYADNEVDASEMLFLDNLTMDGTAQLAPAFVGRGIWDTTWSETMLLYCLYSLPVT